MNDLELSLDQLPELSVSDWLELTPTAPAKKKDKTPPIDGLGPHTAKWDYWSHDGKLLACVYRYDPPSGKEFRPRDVVRGVAGAPPIRPLYNLPGIFPAQDIVLVEGEKCAEALIQQGVTATTLMGGANAPVDKTDLSPLAGKRVLIWPDKDKPGSDYAERVARAALEAGAAQCDILRPPEDKPEKWDAADAISEGFDWQSFLRQGQRETPRPTVPPLPMFSLGALLDDTSPVPPDLIAPRIMTQGGILVLGGAPKVGKSDFLLAWLTHMAAGAEFLGMQPRRPLRVFYLQAEIQYHYLRERVKAIRLPSHRIREARENFIATPQLRLILDEGGLARIIPAIQKAFGGVHWCLSRRAASPNRFPWISMTMPPSIKYRNIRESSFSRSSLNPLKSGASPPLPVGQHATTGPRCPVPQAVGSSSLRGATLNRRIQSNGFAPGFFLDRFVEAKMNVQPWITVPFPAPDIDATTKVEGRWLPPSALPGWLSPRRTQYGSDRRR